MNCKSCHHARAKDNRGALPIWNEPSPADLDLRITVSKLNGSIEDSALYKANVGVEMRRPSGIGNRIEAGDGEASGIVHRMRSREAFVVMPQLGTEEVDEEGTDAVSA